MRENGSPTKKQSPHFACFCKAHVYVFRNHTINDTCINNQPGTYDPTLSPLPSHTECVDVAEEDGADNLV